MVGYTAAVGLDRKARVDPGLDPACQIERFVPSGSEGLRGHARPGTEAALEHHRPLAVDLVGPGCQAFELDVLRARYPAFVPLVLLTHVDQLDLAGRELIRHFLRAELGLGMRECTHEAEPTPWSVRARLHHRRVLYRAILVCSDGECPTTYEVYGPLEELHALACDCDCSLEMLGWPEPVGDAGAELELAAL